MGQVDVGDGLRFHSWGGVDQQQRPVASRQATAYLIGKIDAPGGVEQVQLEIWSSLAA